jgi:uncharacterized protein (DUF1800 family)
MDDPHVPADAPATTMAPDHLPATAAVLATLAVPVLMSGCGSGGGGDADPGDTSPTLSITAIDVRSESDTANAPVTINGRIQPATSAVAFALDGTPGLAADPGRRAASSSRSFLVHVDGGTDDHDVTVTFNPTPTAVSGLMGSTFAQARHLAARTGFGASWDDLLALMGVDYATAVDTIVASMRSEGVQAPPEWINATILTWSEFSSMTQAAQDAYNDAKWPRRQALKEWWLREIVTTPSPFTERMVEFWGNHFVVNIDDVEEPQIAWSWLTLLRTHASGNFRAFVHAMALHPAMLIYLDNAGNTKVRPPGALSSAPANLPSNENFGRELLELFTLGEGRVYTEEDVIQVARAFTGHNLSDRKAYLWKPGSHDTSTDMVILGSPAGQYDGPQAIDLILEKKENAADTVPRAASFVVEKLWAEFIGTTPSVAQVKALAEILCPPGSVNPADPAAASARWNLKPLYRALLEHSAFIAGASDPALKMLKMPLELIGGFYRSLRLTPDGGHWDWKVYDSGSEDQDPLAPPNVKGWLGGSNWINAKTLLDRFLHMTKYGWEVQDVELPANLEQGHELLLLATTRIFPAAVPPSWDTNPFSTKLRTLIKDPAYQIK